MPDNQNLHNDDTGTEEKHSLFEHINNYVLLFYAASCFIIYFTLSGILYMGGYIIPVLIIPGLIAIVMPLALISSRLSSSFSETYRLGKVHPLVLALVILSGLSLTLPADAIAGFFDRFKADNSDYISFLLSIKPKGVFEFLAVFTGVVIVAPFAEELLFRGFIQRILSRNMNRTIAVILAGVLFGLAHFDLALVPATALIGIFFGYLFVRTGNLAYPFAAHAVYNLVSLLRLHLTPEEDIRAGAASNIPWAWLILSAALFLCCIYIFERNPEGEGPGSGPSEN